MASFAQLDENNNILSIIKISNDEISDENGNEIEELGIKKCKELFGEDSNWVQTWFGNPVSKRYRTAAVGGLYIPEHDVFVWPKPFNSWVLNTETYEWVSPIPFPPLPYANPVKYEWDEYSVSWRETEPPKPEPPDGKEVEYVWNSDEGHWEMIEVEEPVGITTS